MTLRRFQVVGKLIEKYDLKVGAEIGVQRGETHKYLLKRFPDLNLYAVDRWEPQPGHPLHPLTDWTHEYNERLVRDIAERTGRSIVLKGDSVDMSQRFKDGQLDFVFIDGDHSVNGIYRDLQAWWSKVHKDGLIAGHDWNWPSVKFVILGLLGRVNYEDDHVWWVRKNGAMNNWVPTAEEIRHYDRITRNDRMLKNRRPLHGRLRYSALKHGKKKPRYSA